MLSLLLALTLSDGKVVDMTLTDWFAEVYSNSYCIYARQGYDYYSASHKALTWTLVRAERSLSSDDYMTLVKSMQLPYYYEHTMSQSDSLIMEKCRDQIR